MGYFFDRVKETTTTTGTGTITLGGAVAGFRTFASVLTNGWTCPYVIEDPGTGSWETGIGTYGGGTLARSVSQSSNFGGLVNFGAGTKYVFIDAISSALVNINGTPGGEPSVAAGGRLTLLSASPVADVSSSALLYYTPYVNNQIGLYDANIGRGVYVRFAETSINISGLGLTADKNYDVFGYLSSGVLTLELVAWTNNTTRATTLTMDSTLGFLVKTGDTTRRYLGTMRTVTTTTMTDFNDKRFLFNYNNRMPRLFQKVEGTSSWTYGTGISNTWRNFNSSATNRVEWVDGIGDVTADLHAQARIYISNGYANANNYAYLGIGIDTSGSTAPGFKTIAYMLGIVYDCSPVVKYVGKVGVGYHFAQAQEFIFSTSAQVTIVGSSESTGGILGSLTI